MTDLEAFSSYLYTSDIYQPGNMAVSLATRRLSKLRALHQKLYHHHQIAHLRSGNDGSPLNGLEGGASGVI